MIHPKKPPKIWELLDVLDRNKVQFILAGSVAASLYGVAVGEPGDLDVVPAMDRGNLERLALVLAEIEACPEDLGHWETKPDGEKTWIVDETSPEVLAAWRPDPEDPATFDHLFPSRLGNFDVVPEVTGTYETLRPRAVAMEIQGNRVWTAHVDDLLATMTVPRREKHIPRVRRLREVQRERAATGKEM
jgi:hypothetical protein